MYTLHFSGILTDANRILSNHKTYSIYQNKTDAMRCLFTNPKIIANVNLRPEEKRADTLPEIGIYFTKI